MPYRCRECSAPTSFFFSAEPRTTAAPMVCLKGHVWNTVVRHVIDGVFQLHFYQSCFIWFEYAKWYQVIKMCQHCLSFKSCSRMNSRRMLCFHLCKHQKRNWIFTKHPTFSHDKSVAVRPHWDDAGWTVREQCSERPWLENQPGTIQVVDGWNKNRIVESGN